MLFIFITCLSSIRDVESRTTFCCPVQDLDVIIFCLTRITVFLILSSSCFNLLRKRLALVNYGLTFGLAMSVYYEPFTAPYATSGTYQKITNSHYVSVVGPI